MTEIKLEHAEQSSDITLPQRAPQARRGMLRLCGSVMAGFLILLMAVGGGALYLQHRAISADFIRDRLVESLQKEFGGTAKVEIGHVLIGGGESYLSAQVLDLVVRGPRGEALLSAPDARIDLVPAALARLEIAVQRLTLDRIALAIDIAVDGTVSVANLGVGEQAPGPAGEVAASILAVMNGKMGVGGGPIPIVAVENGRLEINDARRRTKFLLDEISVSADPAEDGRPAVRIAGKTPGGPVVMRLAPGSEPLTFTLAIDRISPGDIGLFLGSDLKFVSENLPLALNMTTRFDENAKPQDVNGEIKLGRGQLFIDDPDAKPIDVSAAHMRFSYLASDGIVHLNDLFLDAGGLTASVSGTISPVDETRKAWKLTMSGTNGALASIVSEEKPVRISTLALDALILPDARKVSVSRLELTGPQFGAALNGEASFDADGRMAMSIGLSFSRTDARIALHLWPQFVAPELRVFLVKNLQSGILDRLTVVAKLSVETFQKMKERRPIPEDAVDADFSMSDVRLQVADGMPPLSAASFKGRSSGLSASLKDVIATVALPSGKTIAISDASFNVANFGRKPPEAKAQFRALGQTDAMLELLAQPAMQGVLPLTDQTDAIKGQFDGQISVTLPLIDKLKPTDVTVLVKAALTNIVAEHFFGKDRFEASQLQLTSQPGSMTLKGEGKVAGMPAVVDVVQPRKNDAEDAIVTFTMDDAARAKRGIALGAMLTGPMTVKIKSDFPVNTKVGLPVEIDLTKAVIDGLLPGWSKPAGKPARARFSLLEKDGAYRITNIDLDGAAPTLKGSAEVAADGSITSFQFTTVKLSPGDSMQAEGQKTPTGMKVSMRGNSFDTRPFLRGSGRGALNQSSAQSSSQPSSASGPQSVGALSQKEVDIDLKAVALSGFNGEIASNVEVKLVRRGAQLKQGTIAARLNGDQITGKIVPRPDGSSVLNLQTQNAGALLRFMDIYNRMQGGAMDAQVTLKDGRERGWFMVRNFDLRDEPALQRVAAATEPTESGDGSRPKILSNASDVNFSRMRVEFTRTGDQFDVSEGVMWGREVGGTITGQMDYARDRLNFSGTFVPAYGLNNAFAKIPVLGFLLTGNKNEGLFAVPFRITGKLSAPSVTVNPIAAVSPGFLRKIFDFQALPTAQVDAVPE